MNLFVINRYEGENKEVKNETHHFSELLERIEERKKQKTLITTKTTLENVNKHDVEKSNKKRKKCETLIDASDTKESNNLDDKIGISKKSTRKKRKKNDINIEEDPTVKSSVIENQELENKDEDSKHEEDTHNNENKELPSNFMILGTKSQKKQRAVRRILPDWLAHPEVISADLNSGPSLEELHSILDIKLIEALRANGIARLFPVQSSIINWLCTCNKDRNMGRWLRDTCVSAPTGSGKTLAYVLPIIQQLQTRFVPKIRCLIVLPVQELAIQVYKVMITYTSHTNLKVGLLSGASSFEQEQNNIIKKTERGRYVSKIDIIITTPGRLIDHILKTPGFTLDSLKFLVIDEADRSTEWLQYLPESHSRASILTLENLHSSVTIPAQKLLFSATLSQDPEKLSRLGLFHPILFTTVVVSDKDTDVNLDKITGDFVGRYTSPGELTELAVECAAEYKPIALYQLLTRYDIIPKTLVFTNSGDTAHRLALLMQSLLSERNITVGELSAQLASKQREIVLGRFMTGEVHMLISSDALARGLDIPNVQLVVSYDVPKHIKGYIHRAGRTGRAGKSGTAVSVLTSNQIGIFKQMLIGAHKTVPDIERLELNAIADSLNYQSHVEELKEILDKEKNENLERKKATKRRRIIKITKQNENK